MPHGQPAAFPWIVRDEIITALGRTAHGLWRSIDLREAHDDGRQRQPRARQAGDWDPARITRSTRS
jgi:hypothetical protein